MKEMTTNMFLFFCDCFSCVSFKNFSSVISLQVYGAFLGGVCCSRFLFLVGGAAFLLHILCGCPCFLFFGVGTVSTCSFRWCCGAALPSSLSGGFVSPSFFAAVLLSPSSSWWCCLLLPPCVAFPVSLCGRCCFEWSYVPILFWCGVSPSVVLLSHPSFLLVLPRALSYFAMLLFPSPGSASLFSLPLSVVRSCLPPGAVLPFLFFLFEYKVKQGTLR